MFGYPQEERVAEFVRLEWARYPNCEWEHCECWIAQDWTEFEPAISWVVARFHVRNAWAMTTHQLIV